MPIPAEASCLEHRPNESCDLRDGESEAHLQCCSVEGKVYVAVGSDLKENVKNLMWTLKTFRRCKIVILHVHQPTHLIPAPFGGGKVHSSKVNATGLSAYRQREWEEVIKSINGYQRVCRQENIEAEPLILKSEDDVQNVIAEAISHHGIEKLVMGAAADKKYTRVQGGMPTSKKALYVNLRAPPSCKIWFVCKGRLVYSTRASHANRDQLYPSLALQAFSASPEAIMAYRSPSFVTDSQAHPNSPSSVWLSPQRPQNQLLSRSSSQSTLETVRSLGDEIAEESQPQQPDIESHQAVDLGSAPAEVSDDEEYKEMEELLERFKLVMEESQNSKKQAILKARLTKIYLAKEQEQRREAEALLVAKRDQLEKLMTREQDMKVELRNISAQKSLIEALNQELYERLERLHKQDDDAERKAEAAPGEASIEVQWFTEFTHAELVEATNNFDRGLKLKEGKFGLVYKGRIGHAEVAIKVLKEERLQGGPEFEKNVKVLSRLRHPHLVTLIGMCVEPHALIYEYHSKGSLEDRLLCKKGTLPLTWQARIRIASEICSALLFLHSAGAVHGDLKPVNIFLDANLLAKISDVSICRQFDNRNPAQSTCTDSDTEENSAYMDPDFATTGNMVLESDIYSFGMIILRMLIGRPASWIASEIRKVESAMELLAFIDLAAGDWPFIKAIQLAKLGLDCCNVNSQGRPDLRSEVWRVLEPMRASLVPLPSGLTAGEPTQPPTYFICPIFREIMLDPQVAADGYTYEGSAIRGWIDSGHVTSPMTNLKLSHLNLTPNHILRFAIQEWLEQS